VKPVDSYTPDFQGLHLIMHRTYGLYRLPKADVRQDKFSLTVSVNSHRRAASTEICHVWTALPLTENGVCQPSTEPSQNRALLYSEMVSVTNSGCWLDGVGCHDVGFSRFTIPYNG